MSTALPNQRIIVPIDISTASEQAIPFAGMLTKPGDEIILLHVITSPDRVRIGRPGQPPVEHLHEKLHDGASAYLRGLVAEADISKAVIVNTRVVSGTAAEGIVEFAKKHGATLIVMTTAGRGAAGRLAFGSVADQVARTSTVPVMLVHLRDRADSPAVVPMKRVLVPLDGSERSRRALEPAAMVARQLDLPVVLLYVMEISDLSSVYGTTISASTITDLVQEENETAEEALGQAVEDLRAYGVHASWKLLSGTWAAHELEDEVAPGDLVVMASHGYGGVRRWLFGSVSERLIRSGRSPVMLVPSME